MNRLAVEIMDYRSKTRLCQHQDVLASDKNIANTMI